MPLETYIPAPPLSEYVHMLWAWDDYIVPHNAERILPAGMIEITFSLTDVPFRIVDEQQSSTPLSIAGGMASGPRSRHFIVDTARPMSLLSVWFKPGGVLPFLGIPGQELHNLHVPLDVLWGAHASDLYLQLGEAANTQQRFQLLDAALTHRLLRAKQRHRAVQYGLTVLQSVPHIGTIAQVVDEIALSPARFIKHFRDDVGMTPKQFWRVQRFQYALKLIARQRLHDWADIALTCGYYDQAHFNNEFRNFTGITPTAYLPQSVEHNTNLPIVADP